MQIPQAAKESSCQALWVHGRSGVPSGGGHRVLYPHIHSSCLTTEAKHLLALRAPQLLTVLSAVLLRGSKVYFKSE